MSTLARNRLIGFALALTIFAVDQWVKGWVTGPLGLTQIGDHLDILPFFDFTLTKNYGISLRFIRAGTMDQPDHFPPDVHIFTESKQPHVTLAEFVPQYPTYYDTRSVWPKESLQRFSRLIKANASAA